MKRFEKIIIKIKETEVDAILDRELSEIVFHLNSNLVRTSKTGQLISKTPITRNERYYFNTDDVCHNPSEYIKSKDCQDCQHLFMCSCHLNKYAINKFDLSLVVKLSQEK